MSRPYSESPSGGLGQRLHEGDDIVDVLRDQGGLGRHQRRLAHRDPASADELEQVAVIQLRQVRCVGQVARLPMEASAGWSAAVSRRIMARDAEVDKTV